MVYVVEELGLVTCEGIVYRHRCKYSSFCVGAVVLTLGGDDIEGGVPDREQVDCEREEVEEGEEQERETDTKRQQTNTQTHNIMDDMRME